MKTPALDELLLLVKEDDFFKRFLSKAPAELTALKKSNADLLAALGDAQICIEYSQMQLPHLESLYRSEPSTFLASFIGTIKSFSSTLAAIAAARGQK